MSEGERNHRPKVRDVTKGGEENPKKVSKTP
jgi:hypothetical protein